jgi:hypothetical protein
MRTIKWQIVLSMRSSAEQSAARDKGAGLLAARVLVVCW